MDRRKKRDEDLLQFTNAIIEYLHKEKCGNGSFIREKNRSQLKFPLATREKSNLWISNEIFEIIDNLFNKEVVTPKEILLLVNKKFESCRYTLDELLSSLEDIKLKHDDDFDKIPSSILNHKNK
jgi:hypothetical protein